MSKSFRVVDVLKWFVPLAVLGYIYYPTFVWMVERWSARDSYFGHGFMIPLVSLYWVFKKKEVLASCRRTGSLLGLMILTAGALVQIVSSLFRIYFLSGFSFVLVLFGAVYFAFGKKIIREIWFPILFLALAVPLPLLFISEVTLKMKFFVSEVSVHLLNSIGIHSVREGSYIYTPHALALVGDPCSGLRSFLAFLCLGLVFAYDERLVFWKKTVLIISGFPLAIMSNILRVFALSLLGEIYGMDFVIGRVHDASGIVVFIIAFLLLMLIRQKLETARAPLG